MQEGERQCRMSGSVSLTSLRLLSLWDLGLLSLGGLDLQVSAGFNHIFGPVTSFSNVLGKQISLLSTSSRQPEAEACNF
jgi:hypothetical protein